MPSYNVFPSDIEGNSQIGHYVEIRAFPGRGLTQNAIDFGNFLGGLFGSGNAGNQAATALGVNAAANPNQTETFYMYVPGGGQNTLSWQQQHEYTDVKLARVAAGFLGVGGSGGSAPGVLPGLLGTPINPQIEVLFRNTQLRTFQFYFLMSPTSLDESQKMQWIIERLRWHAAPRISNSSLTFEPPSEFEVTFYFRQKMGGFVRNPNLPKIDKCVVERIDVDFTPQGEFSTFSNGHPVSALLSMQFKELSIIDKNKIGAGY